MDLTNTLIVIGCAIAIFIMGRIFLYPIRKILKLMLNTIIGGCLIYVINLIGTSFGFHIGLNVITSLIVGILGIPGAILLIVLSILFQMIKPIFAVLTFVGLIVAIVGLVFAIKAKK